MAKAPPRQFAVVYVNSDEVAYCGKSDWAAARAMVPGTCHGEGRSPRQAITAARELAARVRKLKKMPPTNWVTKHKYGGDGCTADPTPDEITDRSQEVREVGFDSSRYGRRPPWGQDRYLS